jgi:DNA-binding NarL/FixJ family response regulator
MTTLVIVDDDPSFRRVARALLASRFRLVGEAGTLAEAREVIAARRPDAVLVDVNLPDGSGLELGAALAPGSEPPMVVLTSSDDLAGAEDEVVRRGARGFLTKDALSAEAVAALLVP